MATRYKQIDYTLKDFTDKFVLLENRLSPTSNTVEFWIKRAKNGEALFQELMKHTKSGNYSQAIHNYHNNCEDKCCEQCDKPTALKSFTKGYSSFCSFSCGTLNEGTQAKKANTIANK